MDGHSCEIWCVIFCPDPPAAYGLLRTSAAAAAASMKDAAASRAGAATQARKPRRRASAQPAFQTRLQSRSTLFQNRDTWAE